MRTHKQFLISIITLLLFFAGIKSNLYAQYQMENLDRGLVAIHQGSFNLVSWRFFGTDPDNMAFNVYRDGNKLNANPITDRTNYRDNGAGTGARYYIRPVLNGVEQSPSKTVGTWGDQFLEIPLNRPASGSNEDGGFEYMPYDASTADLDGDGQYEIIFKWDPSNAKDNSQRGHTGDVFIEAVKLDGTSMWRLNLGQNIRAGAHYTQFMVYDFDGDGKAEMICKTAPGTRDASGSFLSKGPAANDNDNADYATTGGWQGFVTDGPEYLTVFNGETGREITTVNYVPGRGQRDGWGKSGDNTNRVDRFLAGVAYLDGQHPSAVMCRGYYGRTVLAAWDFDGTNLIQRWVFDTNNGMGQYGGKGNHQLSIADLDNDGKQEIAYGALAIDDDGGVLHAASWGHGDAYHVGDFDLDNPGIEIFMPVEWASANPADGRPGVAMRDGNTGNVLWAKYRDGDIGRGVCANIDSRYPGAECWASGGLGLYDAKGNNIGSIPGGINFTIYWDGDLEREILDGEKLDNYNNGTQTRQYTIYNDGADAINGSKANPNLQADILGDWREELIYRKYDNSSLLVFTTNFETQYRIPTLMHDPQYRMAVAWQNTAYNQPPHPSFYLGSDRSPDVQLPPITTVAGARLEEGFYQISPVHSGLCLQNNAVPSQEACAEADNQYWQVIKVGEEYQIKSLASGQYMGGGTNTQGENTGMSGAPVNLSLTGAGSGNFFIRLASNPSLVFDVLNVSAAEGEPLILWENTGATNQHFTFTPVDIPVDCNGDPYGNATIDECGTCSGGTTGIEACVGALQGENFCDATGVLEATNEGYKGEGYLNFDNQAGSSANWNFIAETAGTYQFDITYANGGNVARSMTVNINGSNQGNFNGVATGGWTVWLTETINVTLNAGVNNLQLVANAADGGPNVDQFTWSDEALTAGGCEMDCEGTMGGSAFEDECGDCVSGNTGLEACTEDCNGEWGGTAVEDNCGRCVGGGTGAVACLAQFEFETACLIDGMEEAINLGFTGDGYANANNEIGSGVDIKLSANESKTYSFLIRYANGSAANRNLRILVNGTEVIANVDFVTTNDWTNWDYQAIAIPLQSGVNEVRFEALTAQGPSNLDNLVFIEEGVTVADCEDLVTDLVETSSEAFELYPNPTNGVVHFNKEVKYELMNAIGHRVSSGSSDQLDLSGYPAGVYLIKVKSTIYKIMRE